MAQPVAKFMLPVTQPLQRLNYKIFGPIIDRWAKYTAIHPIKGAIGLWTYRIMKWGFLTLFALILLTIFGVFGEIPNKEELKNIETANSTEIYTIDSVLIGKYYIENRTEITLDKISPYIITALLAVEDKRFFEHSGIDLMSWMRVFKGIATNTSGGGGGSTLSQQLAKNLYPRRRYKIPGISILINKIRENIISIKLEAIYDKEELISLYLNTVPFGGDRFGINVASRYFYNKKASELQPQEAATLIGMLKATTALDPTRNPENSMKRRNLVLKRMLENNDFNFESKELVTVANLIANGKISQEEYDKLIEMPISAKKNATDFTDGTATYFREYLRTNVMPKILKGKTKSDGTPYNLYTDGLKIYTTIHSKMQTYAEESVAKHMKYLQEQFKKHWKGYPREKPWGDDKWLVEQKLRSDRYKGMVEGGLDSILIDSVFATKVEMQVFDWKNGGGMVDTTMTPLDSIKHYFLMLNTGFMVMSHKNSYIRAWVGGTDFKAFKYDHILSKRQVGSTFKPIVYAAAIKDSLRPCQYFRNQQTTYGDDWTPRNSDNRYGGWYSMVGGLTYSVNTIAANLINKVGIQKTIDLAKAMGVTSTLPREFGISLGSADVNLFDMMKVYGTIANGGLRPEPVAVLKIVDRNGKVIYDYKQEVEDKKAGPTVHALTEIEAAIMSRMMRSVIDNGTGNNLRSQFVPDGEFAGKTGTTQNHSDGWFIAFNEELTTGCWVGAESPAVRFKTMDLGRGAAMALPIVGNFWYKILRDKKLSKIALEKFKVNETANAAFGCPFRIGIHPDTLNLMLQDTVLASEIRENGYRGLKGIAEDYFGTTLQEEDVEGGGEGGGAENAPEEKEKKGEGLPTQNPLEEKRAEKKKGGGRK
ncbi:MAG: transglycosylase domain-containing protein [Saprospiraceae bacterium]|nr:transglycosylase domain-containing protein [Saprospiraceae bacterium]